MSVYASKAVWKHSKAVGSARLVLLCIAEHYNDKSQTAWPSTATIARETRVSIRQVKRAIKQLVDDGELDVIQEGLGRGNTAVYQILLPIEPPKKGDMVSKKGDISSRKGDMVSPNEADIKGDISSRKGDMVSKKGDMVSSLPYRTIKNHYEPLGGEGEAFPYRPPPGESKHPQSPAAERLTAILDVCNLRPSVPAHLAMAEAAAAQLDEFDADTIRRRYTHTDSPNGSWYWYRDDWRGRRGDIPRPEQVVETIGHRRNRPAQPGRELTADEIIEMSFEGDDYGY